MAFIVDEWLTPYYTVVNVSPHEIFGLPAEGHWDPSFQPLPPQQSLTIRASDTANTWSV